MKILFPSGQISLFFSLSVLVVSKTEFAKVHCQAPLKTEPCFELQDKGNRTEAQGGVTAYPSVHPSVISVFNYLFNKQEYLIV